MTIGGDLVAIPHVETEQQRIALALFREAKASNNNYLSLLCFWQVLEVDGEKSRVVADRIMAQASKHPRLDRLFIDKLPLAGRTLGAYLEEDWRHAIAHIKRWAGRKVTDLDSLEERTLITFGARATEALAETFIRDELGLTKSAILVRPRRDGPSFRASCRRKPNPGPSFLRTRTGPASFPSAFGAIGGTRWSEGRRR